MGGGQGGPSAKQLEKERKKAEKVGSRNMDAYGSRWLFLGFDEPSPTDTGPSAHMRAGMNHFASSACERSLYHIVPDLQL
jgi:hypothetical protein